MKVFPTQFAAVPMEPQCFHLAVQRPDEMPVGPSAELCDLLDPCELREAVDEVPARQLGLLSYFEASDEYFTTSDVLMEIDSYNGCDHSHLPSA